LLAHHTLVMSPCSCAADLHRAILLVRISSGLVGLEDITRSRRSLQFAIAHILRLSVRTGGCRLHYYKGWIFPEYLFEVKPRCCSSLLFLDLGVVELDESLEFANDVRAVIRVVGARIMGQPEHLKIWKAGQVSHFLEVADVVLTDVDLLQFRAVREVFERAHFIVRQRDDL